MRHVSRSPLGNMTYYLDDYQRPLAPPPLLRPPPKLLLLLELDELGGGNTGSTRRSVLTLPQC